VYVCVCVGCHYYYCCADVLVSDEERVLVLCVGVVRLCVECQALCAVLRFLHSLHALLYVCLFNNINNTGITYY